MRVRMYSYPNINPRPVPPVGRVSRGKLRRRHALRRRQQHSAHSAHRRRQAAAAMAIWSGEVFEIWSGLGLGLG